MINTFVFGKTTSGLSILGHRFGLSGPHILIVGGVHGDEIEGVWAAQGLLNAFASNYDFKCRLTLVPMFNLDGVITRERRNARGVDLNRNLPSRDWTSEVATERYNPGPSANSESENQALVLFLENEKPSFILSLHSWKPMLNINGDCRAEAESLSRSTGYVIEETIGYPTPGCLGTYAGLERGMPTLTYEVERGLDRDSVLRVHVPAIVEMMKVCERRNA